MNCKHCGNVLGLAPDREHYICPNCGARYKAMKKTQLDDLQKKQAGLNDTVVTQPTAPVQIPQPVQQQPQMQQPVNRPPRRPQPQPQPQPQYNEDDAFDDDEFEDDFEPAPQPAPRRPKQGNSNGRPSGKRPVQQPQPVQQPKSSGGVGALTIVLGVLFILAFAGCAFCFLQWQKAKKDVETLNTQLQAAQTQTFDTEDFGWEDDTTDTTEDFSNETTEDSGWDSDTGDDTDWGDLEGTDVYEPAPSTEGEQAAPVDEVAPVEELVPNTEGEQPQEVQDAPVDEAQPIESDTQAPVEGEVTQTTEPQN